MLTNKAMGQTKSWLMQENEKFLSYMDEQNEKYKLNGVNEEEIYFGSNKLLEVTIPNFSNTIKTADRMRVKPYREGYKTPKIPQKYLTPEYGYKNGKLVELATGNIIPSNSNKAGQPRITVVNGQSLYNGAIKEQARAVFIQKIKDYLLPYFEELPMVYEKGLTCQIHFYVLDKGTKNIDNDNMWIYQKVICDILKQKILPEDNPYIIQGHNTKTIFVIDEYQTKMVVSLIK